MTWFSRTVARAMSITLVSALLTIALMAIYTDNVLQGDLDHHVLPARKFGVPEAVARHGFQVFYNTENDTGWDGQFYYYIANDPLAHKDTVKHVDSDAYRYQRIGLPLLAWIASRIALQDWVSPLVYYLTNLGTVLAATLIGGLFYIRQGRAGSAILLWSLSLGVQLTLMNGLPDATADGLLLISLVMHLKRRRIAYAVFATLAALSREAYVLFPVVIGIYEWANAVSRPSVILVDTSPRRPIVVRTWAWLIGSAWAYVIPAVVFGGWQVYIRRHFHVAPSAQATGILGPPFKALLGSFMDAAEGSHPLLGSGFVAYREAGSLFIFFVLLVVSAAIAIAAWRRSARDAPLAPVAAASIALIALYACFGRTVMEHYTGYMKAAGLFFLIIPLFWPVVSKASRASSAVLLAAANLFFAYYLFTDRIDPPGRNDDAFVKGSQVSDSTPKACLKSYAAGISLRGLEDFRRAGLLGNAPDQRVAVFDVAVTNRTSESFAATTAVGSVNVSYHWMNAEGTAVVKDGIRTFMPGGLRPGETTNASVVVAYPTEPGHYILRLSLVQEGCTWFYSADPSSKLDIDYVIR